MRVNTRIRRMPAALTVVISVALQGNTALASATGPHGTGDTGAATSSVIRHVELDHQHGKQTPQRARLSPRRAASQRIQQALPTQPGTWKPLGPQLLDTNGHDPEKFATGRVLSMAYGGDKTIVAGTAGGGVWTSPDWGATWTPRTDTQLNSLIIGSLAVDPTNPKIIYAGTGDQGGSLSDTGDGIYKSTDAGLTWTSTTDPADFAGTAVSAIVVDPTNPQRVYAGIMSVSGDGRLGVLASADGGHTWHSTSLKDAGGNPVNISDLVIDGHGGLYAAAGGYGDLAAIQVGSGSANGIWYSGDSGGTWTQVSAGLPSRSSACAGDFSKCGGWYKLSLLPSSAARDPAQQTLFVAVSNGVNDTLNGIYRTTSGGHSWTNITGNLESTNPCDYSDAGNDQAFSNLYVVPGDGNSLYVGRVDLFKMDNATGNTFAWKNVSHAYQKTSAQKACPDFTQGAMHADQHAAFTVPGFKRTYFAGDGGIFYSDNGGQTFSNGNGTAPNALGVVQFDGGAINKAGTQILAGTQDNGTLLGTLDPSSHTFGWKEVLGGDGSYSILDPTQPGVMYAENPKGQVSKNTNGGAGNWADICAAPKVDADNLLDCSDQSEKAGFIAPLVMDPSDSNTLYSGLTHLWRTVNGGTDWSNIGPGSSSDKLSAIGISPRNPNVVYVGDITGSTWVTRNARASDANQVSWTLLDSTNKCQSLSPDCAQDRITSIAVDPTDANGNTVYMTIGGFQRAQHVLRSTDGGKTWTDVSTTLPSVPFRSLALSSTGTLYAGGNRGVYVSSDHGNNWSIVGTGLPNAWVNAIILNGSAVYAFTYGRGIWQLGSSAPTVKISGTGISHTVNGKRVNSTVLHVNESTRFVVAYVATDAAGLSTAGTLQFWYNGTWRKQQLMPKTTFTDGSPGFGMNIRFTHADQLGTWWVKFRVTVGSVTTSSSRKFTVTK